VKCGITLWMEQLNQLYPDEVAERITRFVGCVPSFGFLDLGVIELILNKLASSSLAADRLGATKP